MNSPCRWSSAVMITVLLGFAGCAKAPAPSTAGEAEPNSATSSAETPAASANDAIAKAIAELPEAERSAALAQKWCPVAAMDGRDSLLGSMGKPHKVTLNGKDVFLCCEGCVDTAEKDPAAALAKVEELTQRAAMEK